MWPAGAHPPYPEGEMHHVERQQGYPRLEFKVFSLLVTVTDRYSLPISRQMPGFLYL